MSTNTYSIAKLKENRALKRRLRALSALKVLARDLGWALVPALGNEGEAAIGFTLGRADWVELMVELQAEALGGSGESKIEERSEESEDLEGSDAAAASVPAVQPKSPR